jgi:signal transduction histidine kinase/CheY-like chemotaxis protein
MTGKKIIYYLLSAFIAGNILLIYIQYNSAKNINILIEGNEKVLNEADVTNNLRELNRNINSLSGNTSFTRRLMDSSTASEKASRIRKVQLEIDNLQKISDDDTSVKYIDVLDLLVHEKLHMGKNDSDLAVLHPPFSGRPRELSAKAKELNDSIRMVTYTIENSRQKLLSKVTSAIDKSGKKALRLGTTLIVFVLLSGAALFWFIITAIRRQNHLIIQLNASEKNAREAAHVKENFMANMSHEIRTPMNAILGYTNLLQRKELDELSKQYVQTIQRSGENLLNIINDVLDMSKIEAGMMRIESAPFSIRGLVQSVETMFHARVAEKGLLISTHVDESVPDKMEGDATRLTQILINLVGNSIKFTSKGSITINITNEGTENNLVKTGIAITDSGIGIEPDKLNKIFERFKQAEDSVTRKYGGTGLGLSIVHDLVLLQNGTIEVESEAGSGTTFRLMIPYSISSEAVDDKATLQRNLITQSPFENILILVVEDNEINQGLIKHLFSSWNLEFDLALNGKIAVEQLRHKKYDLILMDIQMPVMDGYTAAVEIRSKLKLETPIIAMTAHAMEGERTKCLSFGMDEYISKPIREEKLHQMIARFTKVNEPQALDKKQVNEPRCYRFINLGYMKEVSLGNAEYEKTVTEQFLEAIPDELSALELAWHNKEIESLRQTAHNMRTTVSVMGLNEMLEPYLDAFEYEDIDERLFQQKFGSIKTICTAAIKESRVLLSTF